MVVASCKPVDRQLDGSSARQCRLSGDWMGVRELRGVLRLHLGGRVNLRPICLKGQGRGANLVIIGILQNLPCLNC